MQRRPVLPGWLDSSLDDPQQAETRQADLGGGTPPWPAASSPPHRHVSSVDEGDRSSGGLPCSGSSSCGSSHHATCIISPGGSPCVATSAEAQSSPQELSSHSATPSEWISEVEWDTSLHLPLWVSENERKQIEARMEGWVESLLAVGADVKGLAQVGEARACLWCPVRQWCTVWLHVLFAALDGAFVCGADKWLLSVSEGAALLVSRVCHFLLPCNLSTTKHPSPCPCSSACPACMLVRASAVSIACSHIMLSPTPPTLPGDGQALAVPMDQPRKLHMGGCGGPALRPALHAHLLAVRLIPAPARAAAAAARGQPTGGERKRGRERV